jgi:hypothetical protein
MGIVMAVIAMTLTVQGKAHADSVGSQSPLYGGVFWSQELIPFFYAWRGLARVDYSRTGNVVTIQKVDQSWIISGAGRNNLLGMVAATNIDVFENGSRYVGTIYPAQPGSYIYSPNDRVGGGITYLNWRVANPTFRVNIICVAQDGWGWYQRSWTFRP